jgi:hypothetical protein
MQPAERGLERHSAAVRPARPDRGASTTRAVARPSGTVDGLRDIGGRESARGGNFPRAWNGLQATRSAAARAGRHSAFRRLIERSPGTPRERRQKARGRIPGRDGCTPSAAPRWRPGPEWTERYAPRARVRQRAGVVPLPSVGSVAAAGRRLGAAIRPFSANQGHRAGRVVGDLGADAAEQQARKAGASACAHDDEVDAVVDRVAADLLRRVPPQLHALGRM